MAEWLKRQSHNKCEDWNGQVVKRDRVTREKQLVCLRVVLVDLNKIFFYNFSSFKHLFKDYLLGTLQDILAVSVSLFFQENIWLVTEWTTPTQKPLILIKKYIQNNWPVFY